MEWWDIFKNLLDPEYLVKTGGFILLLFIIFAETGLFFGFFFPGDSLLFTAGLLASLGILPTPIMYLLVGLTAAGILGNFVGYWFGSAVGEKLFNKEDSVFFKKKYIYITEKFFEKYGKMALIAGRFLPIIRTFAPIMAGVIKMDLKLFSFYNVVGSFLWVFSLTLSGYFLGVAFPQLRYHLEYIIIGLLTIPIIPIAITYFRHRHRKRKQYDAKILLEEEQKLKDKLK
jgi:membrane-associated protein